MLFFVKRVFLYTLLLICRAEITCFLHAWHLEHIIYLDDLSIFIDVQYSNYTNVWKFIYDRNSFYTTEVNILCPLGNHTLLEPLRVEVVCLDPKGLWSVRFYSHAFMDKTNRHVSLVTFHLDDTIVTTTRLGEYKHCQITGSSLYWICTCEITF